MQLTMRTVKFHNHRPKLTAAYEWPLSDRRSQRTHQLSLRDPLLPLAADRKIHRRANAISNRRRTRAMAVTIPKNRKSLWNSSGPITKPRESRHVSAFRIAHHRRTIIPDVTNRKMAFAMMLPRKNRRRRSSTDPRLIMMSSNFEVMRTPEYSSAFNYTLPPQTAVFIP